MLEENKIKNSFKHSKQETQTNHRDRSKVNMCLHRRDASIFLDCIDDMRTYENKICDNQPHTEAVGKERQFSVFVCVCVMMKTK